MSEETLPLKAIPSASVDGKVVTLTADKSTGPIVAYGWALDTTSPTDGSNGNNIVFSPYSHKGSDFIPSKVYVTKPGKYVFGLTVYNDKNEQDYGLVTIEVK